MLKNIDWPIQEEKKSKERQLNLARRRFLKFKREEKKRAERNEKERKQELEAARYLSRNEVLWSVFKRPDQVHSSPIFV